MSDLFSNLAERVQGDISELRPLHSVYRPEGAAIAQAMGTDPGWEPGITENSAEAPRIDLPVIPGRIPLGPARNSSNEQPNVEPSKSGTIAGNRETPREVSELQRFSEQPFAQTETSDVSAVPIPEISTSVLPAPQRVISEEAHGTLGTSERMHGISKSWNDVPDAVARLDPAAVTHQRLPPQPLPPQSLPPQPLPPQPLPPQRGLNDSPPLMERRLDDFIPPEQSETVRTPLTLQAVREGMPRLDDAAPAQVQAGGAREPLVWDQTAFAAISLRVNSPPHQSAAPEGTAQRVKSAPDLFGRPQSARDSYQFPQVAPSVIEQEERHVTISIGRLEVRVNSTSGPKPAVIPARSGSALSEYLRERQEGGR